MAETAVHGLSGSLLYVNSSRGGVCYQCGLKHCLNDQTFSCNLMSGEHVSPFSRLSTLHLRLPGTFRGVSRLSDVARPV